MSKFPVPTFAEFYEIFSFSFGSSFRFLIYGAGYVFSALFLGPHTRDKILFLLTRIYRSRNREEGGEFWS